MEAVEPALRLISETAPSSAVNSQSLSRLKPPYWTGISSAGMYLFVQQWSSSFSLTFRKILQELNEQL